VHQPPEGHWRLVFWQAFPNPQKTDWSSTQHSMGRVGIQMGAVKLKDRTIEGSDFG